MITYLMKNYINKIPKWINKNRKSTRKLNYDTQNIYIMFINNPSDEIRIDDNNQIWE